MRLRCVGDGGGYVMVAVGCGRVLLLVGVISGVIIDVLIDLIIVVLTVVIIDVVMMCFLM